MGYVKVQNKLTGEIVVKEFTSNYKLQKYVYRVQNFKSSKHRIIEVFSSKKEE